MKLLHWEFTKRRGIKAKFDYFPCSTAIFRPINHYYFIYNIQWEKSDPAATRSHLDEMEWLINKELGTQENYLERKSRFRQAAKST